MPEDQISSHPDASAALAERLAAVEAGLRSGCHRHPTAVLEEIARLFAAGATITEISAGTGVPRHTVHDRLCRAGALEHVVRNLRCPARCPAREALESHGAGLIAAYEAGATITALAIEAGVCRRTLTTFLESRGVQLRHDRGWYRRSRRAGG